MPYRSAEKTGTTLSKPLVLFYWNLLTTNCFKANRVDYSNKQECAPPNYASRSFKICAATAAAVAGLPTWLIKALRKWSNKPTLCTYVHCQDNVIAPVSKILSTTLAFDHLIQNPDS